MKKHLPAAVVRRVKMDLRKAVHLHPAVLHLAVLHPVAVLPEAAHQAVHQAHLAQDHPALRALHILIRGKNIPLNAGCPTW